MEAQFIAGLDIGGTKIAAVVAGPHGPLVRLTQPTVKTGTERALPEQALALLDDACRQAGVTPGAVKTVGVASAGPFVRIDGLLGLATPNICGGLATSSDLPNDWKAIPLEQVLRERFTKVVIENDCVAALAAERTFGAVRDEHDCVYVTWSTGIGFGLCVDGHILRGKHGNAGHAGHMLMSDTSDALCGCGNRGDLESMISGRNISRPLKMRTAELFQAAHDGNPEAYAVVMEAARWLGRALYNVAATLDTRMFVIGGSVWMHHGTWLRPAVMQEIEDRLPAITEGITVVPAALGTLVADVGALSLVIPAEWVFEWRKTSPWQALLAS
ncbi:glucokinase [Noviherbaspirillum agri]